MRMGGMVRFAVALVLCAGDNRSAQEQQEYRESKFHCSPFLNRCIRFTAAKSALVV